MICGVMIVVFFIIVDCWALAISISVGLIAYYRGKLEIVLWGRECTMEVGKNVSHSVLVTGASGFIGRALCARLLSEGERVRGTMLVSECPSLLVDGVEPVEIEPIGPDTVWEHALMGIDTIFHVAGRVHVMDDFSPNPYLEFRRVNVEGTIRLAREAVKIGIKRIVFVSSIKVNGEETTTAYTTDSPLNPTDPYGVSKWEAEIALRSIEAETGLEVVVVRPTLVYGPGVKANFLNMMKIIIKGIPLPLGSVANRRSLIYVGNLVDALVTCAFHPSAAGKTYLVSDGEEVSTPELIRRTAAMLGMPAHLFVLPIPLIWITGVIIGKRAAVKRLTGSLTVDISKILEDLDWQPPFTMDEGLLVTTEWFLQSQERKN
jgi:nucleoside-diphosphate-sugar epimerase